MNRIATVLTGMSRPKARLCLPVMMTLVLTGVVLFTGACSSDSGDVPFPTQPLPAPQNWLFTVNGNSATDVYAAGARGTMFHYDGNAQNQWTLVPVGTSATITKIWNAGGGTLYATGHGGLIMRNSGGTWGAMTSGTTQNIYGIGRFRGNIYACGQAGTLLRLSGSNWSGVPNLTWILDDTNAPSDTLYLNEDYPSLITVNSFFIGGAYDDPNFHGKPEGIVGTKGGVLAPAYASTFPPADPITGAYSVLPKWILRPLSGEQIVDAEWMLSSTSDPADLRRNYLGTSEGWLFRLSDADGDTVWTKFYPSVTDDPAAGIQAIWLDAAGNVYMVTDEGKIIYQTFDYNFANGTGKRDVLYDGPVSLTGIWGADPGTFFVVGYMDDVLLRCTHDPVSGYFNQVTIAVDFPDAKAMEYGPTVDKFGRPLN